MDKLNEIIEYIAKDKKRIALIAIAVISVIILIFLPSSKKKSETAPMTLDTYKEHLEGEVAKLCGAIDGVGECIVEITFSEGESYKYQSSNLISTTPPRVLGVAVVCEGADRQGVRSDITECITALFDIGSNRVSVLKMEK